MALELGMVITGLFFFLAYLVSMGLIGSEARRL